MASDRIYSYHISIPAYNALRDKYYYIYPDDVWYDKDGNPVSYSTIEEDVVKEIPKACRIYKDPYLRRQIEVDLKQFFIVM